MFVTLLRTAFLGLALNVLIDFSSIYNEVIAVLKNTITTERLLLVPSKTEHASSLYTFWSEKETAGFLHMEPFSSVEEVSELLILLSEMANNYQACLYTIINEDKEIIGSCGFDYIDLENEKAEISYELGKNFQRNGFAFEAMSALIQFGFRELKLNRMEAKVIANNKKSIQLLGKLAFNYEGTLRKSIKIGNHFTDVAFYSILKKEFGN